MTDLLQEFNRASLEASHEKVVRELFTRMAALRVEATDAARRRWVWELMQNAQDAARDGKRVTISIELKKSEGGGQLVFRHDGRAFTMRDIAFLADQVSTKDLEKESSASQQTTGKFGSGFLTTHLLSEKVTLRGPLECDGLVRCVELRLDRSARELPAMKKALEDLRTQVAKWNDLVALPSEAQAPETEFVYELNAEGLTVAEAGLRDLDSCIHYVLAFCRRIESVTLKHEMRTVRLSDEDRDLCGGKIRAITVGEAGAAPRELLVVARDRFSLAIPVERFDTGSNPSALRMVPIPESVPRCFCAFPLVGSEQFPIPVVLNSHHFQLDDKRSHVYLSTSQESAVRGNKKLLLDALSEIKLIIAEGQGGVLGNAFYFADVPDPAGTHSLDTEWYKKEWIGPYKDFLMQQRIVPLENGDWSPVRLPDGKKDLRFPKGSDSASREVLWELLHRLRPTTVPSRESTEFWARCSLVRDHHWTLAALVSGTSEGGRSR